MKWTLAQLRKMPNTIDVDAVLDLSEAVALMDDVIRIAPTEVKGTGKVLGLDHYLFQLHIQTTLYMACAVTLKEVEVKLAIEVEETFAQSNEHDEDVIIVENQTIDLLPVIVANINLHKPMKVVSDGAEDLYMSEEEYENEQKQKPNPAFAALKDFIK